MHKIAAKEFTLEYFSCEHLHKKSFLHLIETIKILNVWRDIYLNGGEVDNLDGTSCNIYEKNKSA